MDVAGLVLEAAHSGVLNRGGLGVQRVDLHEPAKAVRLVRLLGHVEAVIVLFPLTLGRAFLDAEALEGFSGLLILDIATGEILVEVLFAREHGVPRGHATGAVVEGTQDLLTLRVGGGLHQVGALGGAHQGERGGSGNAAVERAELALEFAGALHLGDLEDGVAVASPTDLYLLLGGVLRVVVREHHRLGGVLMRAHVDHAVLVIRVLDEAGEVIVEAELLLRIRGSLVVDVEFRRALDDRVTPGNQDGLLIALGDDDLILGVGLNGLEVHALGGGELDVGALDFAGLVGGAASCRILFVWCGTRSQGGGTTNGDDGQATGTQGGTAGELIAEVRVIGGVLALAEAGITALVGAGKRRTRRGKHVSQEIAAIECHESDAPKIKNRWLRKGCRNEVSQRTS